MSDTPINILETRTLSRHYGGVIALSKVTLQIHPGQISSLIGPNGAGKTTLFNCVTGLDSPTIGHVFFFGKTDSRVASGRSNKTGDRKDVSKHTSFFRIDGAG